MQLTTIFNSREREMEAMQILHMNNGEGETSYAKNSTVQRKIIAVAKSMVEEAVLAILSENFPESMGIADLGCSSGPNTLIVASKIIDIVHSAACRKGLSPPELRVSLNDLPGNDFNDIFQQLPDFYKKLRQEKGGGFERRCFISGTAGSFYGRLFPNNSLHFVHSSSSLHWLSQVPAALENNKEEHLNKGKIYISKSSPVSVVEAYASQFKKDFMDFLKSRSEEMVSNGRMVLSFMGRRSADPSSKEGCQQWELLAQALMAMASEGLVEEEKIDSFNAPYYAPSPEEVRMLAETEASFLVDRLEAFEIEWDGGGGGGGGYNCAGGEMPSKGHLVAKTVRAVVEPMLESHFGKEMDMDDLFRRYAGLVGDYLSVNRSKYVNLAVSFVKKR
ncbi:probable jasmonic acid carboxyl methyltransferase 2 isoform X2 [Diospyros lotus]|uniref:probable jasmonic acid carboxyl methyltransferase 2 isoform X2 n=1 Tax=Diospyros lotus TaxID=55363 RepID=UPI00225C1E6D|nr:probable jasmonic acid carboxyl methyltransferase 2 isoform X2 [Diospyros lotus]